MASEYDLPEDLRTMTIAGVTTDTLDVAELSDRLAMGLRAAQLTGVRLDHAIAGALQAVIAYDHSPEAAAAERPKLRLV